LSILENVEDLQICSIYVGGWMYFAGNKGMDG